MRNLSLALRMLVRTPVVTAIAVLSLGLGIGSNAAIYSIFHRMLRQDLRVAAPDRLVNLSAPGPKSGGTSCNDAGSCDDVLSYPMFRDLQHAHLSVFSALVGHRGFGANVAFGQRSFSGRGILVSGTYFPTLGLAPALGRLLQPSDDETIGGHPVVVLSHRYWENQLGADSSVIGKTLAVNRVPLTIVGVAPKDFQGTTYGFPPEFFAPLAMSAALSTGMENRVDDRRAYWLYAFARLAPGVSIEQARAAINAVYRPILQEVEAPLQKGMPDSTLARFRARQLLLSDGRRGQSNIASDAAGPLGMLFAITGLVLLLACANIANILMARAMSRELEMGVRLSLGASRPQLLGQLLTESVTLAAAGGLVSLLFASWTLRGITALLPSEIANGMDLRMNWAAVAFAGVLSVVTGVAFGLVPALHSTRHDLVTALRNASDKVAGGRAARRVRSALATAQVALAMALLMSAGLFVKSLWNVSRVQLGVDADKLVTFSLAADRSGYDSVRARALFAQVEEALRALPGASGVTSTMVGLVAGSSWNNTVSVEGFKPPEPSDARSSFNAVSPGHFGVTGVRLLAGREFTDADIGGAAKVAIVNETFARHFGLGANPVGKRMANRTGDTVSLDMEIVGLVRDAKYSDVKKPVPPVFFVPHRQVPDVGELHFYIRTDNPAAIIRAVPGVVRRFDPMLPVDGLRTMPEDVKQTVFVDRMISTLSAAFALLATILAAIGLYGVLAYSVAQRTREIGVRMALGAAAGQVRAMVLRQMAVMVLVGAVIGVAGAIALGKVAQSMLYDLSGTDPVVMTAAVGLLALVAMAAGYVPALRASRVDPMQALRYE